MSISGIGFIIVISLGTCLIISLWAFYFDFGTLPWAKNAKTIVKKRLDYLYGQIDCPADVLRHYSDQGISTSWDLACRIAAKRYEKAKESAESWLN